MFKHDWNDNRMPLTDLLWCTFEDAELTLADEAKWSFLVLELHPLKILTVYISSVLLYVLKTKMCCWTFKLLYKIYNNFVFVLESCTIDRSTAVHHCVDLY